MDRHLPPRFSLLNPRMIIAMTHVMFGLVCLLRPGLGMMYKAYRPFGSLEAWGWALLLLGILLISTRRGSAGSMVLQLVSATVLFTISLLLTAGVGLLPTAAMTAWLGVISLILFGTGVRTWLLDQPWYEHILDNPPPWIGGGRHGR